MVWIFFFFVMLKKNYAGSNFINCVGQKKLLLGKGGKQTIVVV